MEIGRSTQETCYDRSSKTLALRGFMVQNVRSQCRVTHSDATLDRADIGQLNGGSGSIYWHLRRGRRLDAKTPKTGNWVAIDLFEIVFHPRLPSRLMRRKLFTGNSRYGC